MKWFKKKSEFEKMTPAQQRSLRITALFLATMEANKPAQIPGNGNWLFRMSNVCVPHECGSAGCILGLAKALETEVGRSDTWNTNLHNQPDATNRLGERLFFPVKIGNRQYRTMGPLTAAQAVKDFIAGENAPQFTPIDDNSVGDLHGAD